MAMTRRRPAMRMCWSGGHLIDTTCGVDYHKANARRRRRRLAESGNTKKTRYQRAPPGRLDHAYAEKEMLTPTQLDHTLGRLERLVAQLEAHTKQQGASSWQQAEITAHTSKKKNEKKTKKKKKKGNDSNSDSSSSSSDSSSDSDSEQKKVKKKAKKKAKNEKKLAKKEKKGKREKKNKKEDKEVSALPLSPNRANTLEPLRTRPVAMPAAEDEGLADMASQSRLEARPSPDQPFHDKARLPPIGEQKLAQLSAQNTGQKEAEVVIAEEEDDEIEVEEEELEMSEEEEDDDDDEEEEYVETLDKPWAELEEEERSAALSLGYEPEGWPAHTRKQWDAWDDLPDELQEAATELGMDEYTWPPSARRPTTDQLRAEFDDLDVNASGTLEKNELVAAMQQGRLSDWFEFMPDFNPGCSFYDFFDKNKDGRISFDEFCVAFGVEPPAPAEPAFSTTRKKHALAMPPIDLPVRSSDVFPSPSPFSSPRHKCLTCAKGSCAECPTSPHAKVMANKLVDNVLDASVDSLLHDIAISAVVGAAR